MNRRPGQTRVTTEVAYCSFCGRPRTLRREEHQLGTLVRTIVTCESCHRTLSSTMGVVTAEAQVAKAPAPVEQPAATEARATNERESSPKPKRRPAKQAAKKPAATAKKAPPKRTAAKK